jgi:hypothetical protein
MMDTPLTSIVERINHTLENVVAPEIESPIVRGQLFAAAELLNQLQGRFEVRHDFLVQDIQAGKRMLATINAALRDAGVEEPAEILMAEAEVPLLGVSGDRLREEKTRVESAVSTALDLLDTHREAVTDAEKVERAVLEQIGVGILRDLGLFRRQRFDKISQRVQEEP